MDDKAQKELSELVSLMKLPEEYQDVVLHVFDQIKGVNEKLGKVVNHVEGYQSEELTPLLTDLIASVSALRDLLQNKNVDFTPIQELLEKVLAEVSVKPEYPDPRTDELLVAIKELSKSFPEIKIEKTEVDFSGVEQKLQTLIEKETPLPEFPELPEIPQDEQGRVPVKLDSGDIEQIGKGIGKNIKVGGGGGMPSDVAQAIVFNLQNYKLTDIDDTTATEYYGYTDKDGNWYIKKVTSSAIRFIKGTSDYTTNWTGRAALSYDYFYSIF